MYIRFATALTLAGLGMSGCILSGPAVMPNSESGTPTSGTRPKTQATTQDSTARPSGTNTTTAPTEIWNPAPCPAGWVRPEEGEFLVEVLNVDRTPLKSSFDPHRSYPKAHAYGTCMRVADNELAEVHLEFGPEVQGYPQSLLKIAIDSGENNYRIESKKGYTDPEDPPGMTLSYTHVFPEPGAERPRFKTWHAGKQGPEALEYHELHATWVSPQPGHYLAMDNKTIIEGRTSDSSVMKLDLGFRLNLRLPGGPAAPTPEFCATLNSQARCDALQCGRLIGVSRIQIQTTCQESVQSYCWPDSETQEIELSEEESRTYRHPMSQRIYTTVYRQRFDKTPIRVPKDWVACAPGSTSTFACDCSCANAGCKPERLRKELEQCAHPRPCADLTERDPDRNTNTWNETQRCVLEKFRDRAPGSYRLAFNLGDPDYDFRMHITKEGTVYVTEGSCDHSSIPGCRQRSWSYPSRCTLAEPQYFSDCLADPSKDCFSYAGLLKNPNAWYSQCSRLEDVDCSR